MIADLAEAVKDVSNMFDLRRLFETMADTGAPSGEGRRIAKLDHMVFDRLPAHEKERPPMKRCRRCGHANARALKTYPGDLDQPGFPDLA